MSLDFAGLKPGVSTVEYDITLRIQALTAAPESSRLTIVLSKASNP